MKWDDLRSQIAKHIYAGETQKVLALLENCGEPISEVLNRREREYRSETLLHTALLFGKIDLVKIFLQLGADPNKPERGRFEVEKPLTLLHKACGSYPLRASTPGNVRRQQTTYSRRAITVRSRSVFATSQQNRDDASGAISCKSRNTSAAATRLRRSLSPSWPLPPNFSVNTIDEPLASFRIRGSRISSNVDGALLMSHTKPPNS